MENTDTFCAQKETDSRRSFLARGTAQPSIVSATIQVIGVGLDWLRFFISSSTWLSILSSDWKNSSNLLHLSISPGKQSGIETSRMSRPRFREWANALTPVAVGVGDDVMPWLCEDKCDGNALWGEFLCQLHCGIDVALPRHRDDYGMNTSFAFTLHLCRLTAIFLFHSIFIVL